MPRIPYPIVEALSAALRYQLDQSGLLNVTRMMSHNDGVMTAVSRLGSELLMRGTLAPTLRELVILRVGHLCDSTYEKHQHLKSARRVGVDEAKLLAVESGDLDLFDINERLALRLVEELYRSGAVSESTLELCSKHFSSGQLVELCILAGFYIMICGFLKTFDIEIETTHTGYRPGTLGQILD